MLRRWFGATAVGQMITEKPLSVFGGQAPENNAPMFQPSPEVLDHPNTPSNPVVRVTVGCQVDREVPNYYVKVMPNDAATGPGSRDELLSCGGIGTTLRFHRFRHPSPYPWRLPNTNSHLHWARIDRRSFP